MSRFPLTILYAALSVALPGQATADEPRPAAKTGFMLADVDGDGRVTLEELRTLLHARFSALDADSDGRVTITDLQRPQGPGRSGSPEGGRRPPPPGGGQFRGPPPGGGFGGPPPGGPGGPPPGPPPQGMGGPPPHDDRAGDFPFPQPEDSNEDGFISRAEFLAPAAAMLDAWDRNRDGVVTADEVPPPATDTKTSPAPRKGE